MSGPQQRLASQESHSIVSRWLTIFFIGPLEPASSAANASANPKRFLAKNSSPIGFHRPVARINYSSQAGFADRIGPWESKLYATQYRKGIEIPSSMRAWFPFNLDFSKDIIEKSRCWRSLFGDSIAMAFGGGLDVRKQEELLGSPKLGSGSVPVSFVDGVGARLGASWFGEAEGPAWGSVGDRAGGVGEPCGGGHRRGSGEIVFARSRK